MIYGIRAGQLRTRAVIETDLSPTTPDQPDWQPFAVRTVGVDMLRGREATQANQIYGACDSKIVLRYLRGLHSAMRFVIEGQVYNITAVIDTQLRHREHIVYATAVSSFNSSGNLTQRIYEFPSGGIQCSGTT